MFFSRKLCQNLLKLNFDKKSDENMFKKDKPKEVEKIVHLIESYPIIGILNIYKLPSRQLQIIKQKLEGVAKIRVGKKNIIKRALDRKPELKTLKDKISGQPALILTKMNPFKLYKLVKENKSPAPAKIGDIAPKDIEIKAGKTDLQPGPAITTLQKVGIKTRVEGGKITILSDCVICKKGERISEDVANVLGLLKIEPMEIGLDLLAACEGGIIYDKNVLDIDEAKYESEIRKSVKEMTNLSIFVGYPIKETIEIMLRLAYLEMKSIGIDAEIVEKDIINDIIAVAELKTKTLKQFVGYN